MQVLQREPAGRSPGGFLIFWAGRSCGMPAGGPPGSVIIWIS
jgi:hypothetical protein